MAALLTAWAASAQTAAYGPRAEASGLLPWIFALFVGAAVLGVFLVVLMMARTPPPGRDEHELPGAARRR